MWEVEKVKERFETFSVLINRISRNLRKIKNQEMAEYNLRSSHVLCLYYLYSAEGLTATELCERCEEDKATISRSIDYLETNGYLTCESKSSKRYKSPLILTEKGKAAAKAIVEKVSLVLGELNDGLTEAERAIFYRCLGIISQCLDTVARSAVK